MKNQTCLPTIEFEFIFVYYDAITLGRRSQIDFVVLDLFASCVACA